MNKDIPLDGTNVDDAITDKDGISLLIMRQAFLDTMGDAKKNDEETNEVTDEVIKEKE